MRLSKLASTTVWNHTSPRPSSLKSRFETASQVHAYEDNAYGIMAETPRPGRFLEVVLRPKVTIGKGGDKALAAKLHERAHAECFVANSVNFPVRHEATIVEPG